MIPIYFAGSIDGGENLHIIHHDDLDGITAAWVFYSKYPNAKFHMVSYGDPLPCIEEDPYIEGIIIVDFSFDRDTIELWSNLTGGRLVLLDHHKSAQERLGDLPYCHFDMTKCGARLAWEYCFPRETPHWLVDYVEDLDLWKWEKEHTKFIIPALESYKFDIRVWDELAQKEPEDLIAEGEIIYYYNETLIKDHLEKVELVDFKGYHNVPLVYCGIYAIGSDLGNRMLTDYPDCPFSVTWRISGGKLKFSLRSDDTKEDVSTIAKKFGGGGHRNAGGFELPFKLENS